MFNLSSAMGQTFADIVKEMTERIRELGPNPLRREGLPRENQETESSNKQDVQDKIITGQTGQEQFSLG
jgi:hypothetical protein